MFLPALDQDGIKHNTMSIKRNRLSGEETEMKFDWKVGRRNYNIIVTISPRRKCPMAAKPKKSDLEMKWVTAETVWCVVSLLLG